MKYLFTGFTAIVLFLFSLTPVSAQNKDSSEGDRQALIDLYSSTNGDNWDNNSGWLNGNPSNDWYGVEVNGDGRVIKLDLYKNNLSGELPETIGNLRELRFFSVKRNPIYSRIPQSIENWVQAETVMFSSASDYNMPNEATYNDFLGKRYIHSISKYYGTIPDVFDRMPNLKILEIAWSEDLDGQPFPTTLYQHLNLEVLVLQAVKLEGTLVDKFDLPKLKLLVLGNNHLGGSLPSTLGNSTELTKMFFSHSGWFKKNYATRFFSGALPASYSNLVNMQRFFIGNQNLEGEIPGFIIEKWPLREFKIINNEFTGEIPKEFGDHNLIIFNVGGNNFTGNLHPRLISGMQNVIIFDVSRNELSGEIPNGEIINGEFKGWRTKTGLRSVYFNANNFSGRLPDMPKYVGDISLVFFRHNNFSGGIPDSWKELFTSALRDANPNRVFNNLTLRDNQLQGVIPEWFTSMNGPTDDIGGNKWSHKDILENGVNVGINYLEYSTNTPKPFGYAISQKIPEGGQLSFDYSHKVHSTDEVQWTKNGSPITGANSSVLTIQNVNISDEGQYRLELTNKNGVSFSNNSTVVSEPIELIIGEPDGGTLSVPSMSSPINDSNGVSVSPILKWGSVSLASNYQLQLARDQNFMDMTVELSDISITQQTISGLKHSTTYHWRIKAVNSNGGSEWSESWSFTTENKSTNDDSESSFPNEPTLFMPDHQGYGTVLTPEFKWSDIGADYYILHVSRLDPTGMSIDVVVEDTTFIPSEILGDGAVHDWRVRGVKNGEMGAWSEIRRFTTREENLPAVADLQTPVHFAQKVDPDTELIWEDISVDSYEIRVIDKKTGNVIFADVTAANMYNPTEALPDTSEFIWQVKSIRGGEQSAWGPRWEFSTGMYEYSVESPSLIAPDQGSEYDNLRPVFEWSPVDADHYVIVVSKEETSPAKALSGLQNEAIVIQDETTTTEYTPQSALEPETVYYWRVQAVKDGEEGEWSEVWEFRTTGVETSVSVGDVFEKPIETALKQNYPNPFNPSTQIEFTLDEMNRVSLAVYDMAGREVVALVDEVLSAGRHVSSFNAGNLSSGVYIYRLIAGESSHTKKMTLIK